MPSRASRGRRFDDDLGILGLPGDVSPWDVRFDAHDPADLEPVGDGRFRVRVQSEPGLTDGHAVLRLDEGVEAIPLAPVAAGRWVQWTAVLGPFDRPVGLSFAFRDAASRSAVYLVPSGISVAVERLDRWIIDPSQPSVDVPEWAKGAVIYQIFPDRFANGDPDNDPPGVDRWGSPPHPRQFQGGDLAGVMQRLDHLQTLGVDAVYLNPIFTSPSNHKYDTVDYFSVDPALGGDQALRRLVTAAHDAGIRVILDASFNHVHPRFFAFADLVEKGPRSEYRDWFAVHEWPIRIRVRRKHASRWALEQMPTWEEETGIPVEEVAGRGPGVEPTYAAWNRVPTMPRIDLSHPDARRYVLDVARHWLAEFDIDGWRMDVARQIQPDFWPEFRAACRQVEPDAYLLAEIMGDASDWLRGDGFDATMNYTFRSMALRFFATEEMDGPELLDHCARLYGRHALATTLVNHNLIGSHDTPRFRTAAGGELWRLELATVFQLTFPGAPGIYYGDEFGLEGGDDPGCRGAVPWDEVDTPIRSRVTITDLTALRRRHPVLRTGEFAPVVAASHAVAYQRMAGRTRYLIGINRGEARTELDVGDRSTSGRSTRATWGAGDLVGGRLRIEGRSAVIVRL